jgi:hypothetical protein
MKIPNQKIQTQNCCNLAATKQREKKKEKQKKQTQRVLESEKRKRKSGFLSF